MSFPNKFRLTFDDESKQSAMGKKKKKKKYNHSDTLVVKSTKLCNSQVPHNNESSLNDLEIQSAQLQ